MLALPEKGFMVSVDKHNCDLDTFCDWIEASVLFSSRRISRSDVVDVLCDDGIYIDKDFAEEYLTTVWSEIEKRNYLIKNSSALRIQGRIIEAVTSWRRNPAYSFCVFLSIVSRYKRNSITNPRNFSQQGDLFEKMSLEALSNFGWSVFRVGWSSTNANKFSRNVIDVINVINDSYKNDVIAKMFSEANDLGLDLICQLQFPDHRGGKPVYMAQCASGADWRNKLKTPDLDLWKKIITFSQEPQRAFVMPFALSDDNFTIACMRLNGMLVDRSRLLSVEILNSSWLPKSLKGELISWLSPLVDRLCRAAVE